MDWTAFSASLNSDAGGAILMIIFVAVVLYFNRKEEP